VDGDGARQRPSGPQHVTPDVRRPQKVDQSAQQHHAERQPDETQLYQAAGSKGVPVSMVAR